jgi:RNA polymerase sigma factor (sigma-70 family)
MEETDENGERRRQAFKQNWSAYYKRLYPFALKLTENEADAEDITQEALLAYQAHREKNQWEAKVNNEIAYLKTIIRNQRNDLWRRRKQEGLVSCDDEQDEQTRRELDRVAMRSDDFRTAIEDGVDFKKLYHALPIKIILNGLTDEELEFYYLNVVDQMTPTQIARQLGLDENYVRYQVNKTKAKIRGRVKGLTKGNEGDGGLL